MHLATYLHIYIRTLYVVINFYKTKLCQKLSIFHLFILRDGDVLLDSQRPINVEDVLVQSQHEHDQHEESVEHGEEEDGLVAELAEALSDLGLE